MTDAEYRIDPEEAVAAAIDAAEEIDDSVADEVPEKPRLLVDKSNPHCCADDDEVWCCVEGASGLSTLCAEEGGRG